MKNVFKQYLFNKNILVNEETEKSENALHTLISLYSFFNIKINRGYELAHPEMIGFVSTQLGWDVPTPFYSGFPRSVRELTADELLFDQLVHYTVTYGFGNFSEAGHSLFEGNIHRSAFVEATEVKNFAIISEGEAVRELRGYVDSLLAGSRPLSKEQYGLVKEYIMTYKSPVSKCASKNTAIRLLLDCRDLSLAEYISMSDVIKLVEELNYREYANKNIRQLNLRNKDRKFITELINSLCVSGKCDIRTCYEKKALWCGLLHHIHYQPVDDISAKFVECMRGAGNHSVYAEFEKALAQRDIQSAVMALKKGKSGAAVLRNLNYIVSRCQTEEDIAFVVNNINTENAIVMIQLLLQYAKYPAEPEARTFKFTKFDKLKVHREDEEETSKRHSFLSNDKVKLLEAAILSNLKHVLKNKLGKVYIDPVMEKYALPLQETTSQGGYGVLPKGTRLSIGDGKKIRAFTYWEKVNDIDLSVIGIGSEGEQYEFSWRSMWGEQSDAITYSGDQTSGYNGGSEYFDIDLEAFKAQYPQIEHLIFCNNVFSRIPFKDCVCRAGYMLRDVQDSGEVFEPKTVKSSFTINCDSTFAYLFGIDLKKHDFVWLNVAPDSNAIVAGATKLAFLLDYFYMTSVINLYSFFEMMATEIVNTPGEADVVVSDQMDLEMTETAEVIRSYNTERIIELLNSHTGKNNVKLKD